MCIPTRVVSPAVTSTAGFLRANIARMNKVVTKYKYTNKTQVEKVTNLNVNNQMKIFRKEKFSLLILSSIHTN